MSQLQYDKKSAGDLSRDQDAAEAGPEEALRDPGNAEEAERDEGQAGPSEPPARNLATALEREARPLQDGRTLDSPFGPLPVRSVAALAAVVLVSTVVYFVAWALFGTLGLVLGWIPAVALGLIAGREVGLRTG